MPFSQKYLNKLPNSRLGYKQPNSRVVPQIENLGTKRVREIFALFGVDDPDQLPVTEPSNDVAQSREFRAQFICLPNKPSFVET